VASAYTLSINTVVLPASPVASTTVTFTLSVAPEQSDPPINSAQGLITITGGGTFTTVASTPLDSPYGGNNGWTGNPFTVNTTTRGRLLFGPDGDGDGQSDEQALLPGVMFQITATVPAGAAPNASGYPVIVEQADTYFSDLSFGQYFASSVQNGALVILPEPASALLLLGALPFLRRRSA
jgi:hypothetical protein